MRAWLLLGAAVLVVAIVVLTGSGEDRVPVSLTVAGARGVVAGAEVRSGGVVVGRVASVALGDDGLPRLGLDVDRALTLRRGARAVVRLTSLSGEFNRYVELSPGTGAPLPTPVRLGLSSTAAPVELDQALQALDPSVRADVRGTLRGLRTAMDGNGPALALTLKRSTGALRAIGAAAGDVAADGAALRALLRDTRTVAGSLSAADLAGSVDETRALLRVTAERSRELSAALSRLPSALAAPRRALASTRAATGDLRALIRDLRPAARQLPGTARELRAATAAARPALRSGSALAAEAPATLGRLTPVLRRALPVLEVASPVLRRSGPMLDQLRVRLPDAFSFFANWADFTSNYDANGHGARVGIVLPPASTKVLDPSGNGEGQLKAPYLRTPGALEGEPWTDYRDSFVGGDG